VCPIVLAVISTLSEIIFPTIISVALKVVLLPSFAVYSSICVFRSSPNPKVSFKGALAKLWAVVFVVYALFITKYTVSVLLGA
jgi:hypothetical protein